MGSSEPEGRGAAGAGDGAALGLAGLMACPAAAAGAGSGLAGVSAFVPPTLPKLKLLNAGTDSCPSPSPCKDQRNERNRVP